MNCNQVKTELIAYLKGELDPDKKKRLEEHLAQCPGCRAELEEARRVLEWTEAASDEAVIAKVNEMIKSAIKAGASDIHIEPQSDNSLRVRQRVDGVLHEVDRIDPTMRNGVNARIKSLAELNIAERRVPQDGRILYDLEGKHYDLRVSDTPFIYGEKFVMRILDQSSVLIGLDNIGLDDEQLEQIKHLAHQPNGMVIVTGPTGSGKTTTMYSMLLEVKNPGINVMTIEDPVELRLDGVNQAHVSVKAGYTFHSALRSFLRQDPDVIMIGDVRDYETASLGIQAALTGHLIVVSLHTDNAIGAIERLRDMQVEPYLISASVIGIVAQRLIRKVCSNCAEDIDASPSDPTLRFFGITQDDLKNHKLKRGKGCEICRHTGYRGRSGVFEVLTVSRDLAAMIPDNATTAEMMEQVRSEGFRSMKESAKQKILEGVTTPEEAFRVLA